MIKDTVDQARRNGIFAAHEKITPLCPYSQIYDKNQYDAWYDGLASERKHQERK